MNLFRLSGTEARSDMTEWDNRGAETLRSVGEAFRLPRLMYVCMPHPRCHPRAKAFFSDSSLRSRMTEKNAEAKDLAVGIFIT